MAVLPFSGADVHSLLQRERNRHLYPSSLVPGLSDLDASAKRKRPLPHAQDPQRFGAEPRWIVDSLAVVLDFEHENALVDLHRDVDPGRARVARDVGEQLLEDPEGGGRALPIEHQPSRGQSEPAPYAAALLEFPRLPFDR